MKWKIHVVKSTIDALNKLKSVTGILSLLLLNLKKSLKERLFQESLLKSVITYKYIFKVIITESIFRKNSANKIYIIKVLMTRLAKNLKYMIQYN